MPITIRQEREGDEDAVRRVNTEAFERPDEAELVDQLRRSCPDRLSLVAVEEESIVGHILFTTARIGSIQGMGLAPMAVAPAHQRRGVGGRLIASGLEILEARRCPFVIVLGHPKYYPRFGFEPASRFGIRCKWDVPDDAFMISRLDPAVMEGVQGLAEYREEFG